MEQNFEESTCNKDTGNDSLRRDTFGNNYHLTLVTGRLHK